jgi:putative spermidine/putrescine transport system substrate-binding protein
MAKWMGCLGRCAAIAVLALAAWPLPSATAADESGKTLVVGVWGGDIERLIREHVVAKLEQQTGAKVELLLGGTGDRLAKLYAERNHPTMDVAFLNIYEAPQAQKDGIVDAPDPDASYAKAIWPGMNHGCYAMSLNGLGIAYSKKTVPTPPEWADMWKPEYKGKIALPPYPSAEDDGVLGVAARLAGADEHSPDKAFAKLAELKPIAVTYTSLDQVFGLMDSGDVAMAPMIGGYAMAALKKDPDLGFVYPKNPGPVLVRDMLCLVAHSPHPELAKQFAALALGVDTQTAYAKELYFGPTNMNVKAPASMASEVIATPEQVKSLLSLDWPYIISQRSKWTDRWNKEILGD